MRTIIANTVSTLVTDFLYYDRKEDTDLQVGDIEKAIKDGIISIDDMVDIFKWELVKGVK